MILIDTKPFACILAGHVLAVTYRVGYFYKEQISMF